MPRPDPRPLFFLLAVVLCLSAFTFPAFAAYESDETGGTAPPEYIGSIINITSEDMGEMPEGPEPSGETLAEPESSPDMDALFENLFDMLMSCNLSGISSDEALTPDGNLTLVDDISQDSGEEGKQFLTVKSKNGNYFYLVIDRSGDKENVHFLNLVDESDLLALTEDGEKEEKPATCTCKDRCYAGHVDTSCAICAVNMTECTGKAPEPTPAVEVTLEPETTAKKSSSGAAVLLLIAVLGGGAAFYFLKVKGKGLPFGKGKASGSFRESENEESDDDFLEFEKSDEPEGEPDQGQPDNGKNLSGQDEGDTVE